MLVISSQLVHFDTTFGVFATRLWFILLHTLFKETIITLSFLLPSGLRFLVTDMLAGLLESNTDKMWSFETLFHMVQSTLNMRALDILCISTGQLLKVYIDPNSS